jgi:glycine/D-amino acid oxidase-like deaminating enzyme
MCIRPCWRVYGRGLYEPYPIDIAGRLTNWPGFAPSVAPLGALSFKLHKELAETHGGRDKWGYCKSIGTSLTYDGETAVGGSGEDWLRDGSSRANAAGSYQFSEGDGPAWLTRAKGSNLEIISQDGSVAQVDPKRLCQFLLGASMARGINLHHPAKVISISKDTRDELAAVRIAFADGVETDIPCTRLVITAGPWTPTVFATLFPSATIRIPISPLAGHSLLVKSPRWSKEHETKGCHAVFAADDLGFSPEIFSRLSDEVYIAGLNSTSIPLPELSTDAKIRPEAIETLKQTAKKMLGLPGCDDDLQILREGLCFRPVTSSGRPIISKVPDSKLGGIKTRGGGEGGVFVAAGHGAWGIAQSLGSGKVLTELIEGQRTSANIQALTLQI